jgi:hypothetical protein
MPARFPDSDSSSQSAASPAFGGSRDRAADQPKRTEVIETGSVKNARTGSTGEILQLVKRINQTMDAAIEEINEINARTKLLALNARIEAARAGEYGAAFGVVAAEMQKLASSTSDAANQMASRTHRTVQQLFELIGSSVRGTRLSDLALVNIDVVDRSLYERTCDARSWASDVFVWEALRSPNAERLQRASARLGTILNSHTVYADIVIADVNGIVVANGRPQLHRSVDRKVERESWFADAMSTLSGSEYASSPPHRCVMASDRSTVIYSAAIREGGRVDGKPIGVLGVLFDWETFAQSLVQNTPLPADEQGSTRVVIADNNGRILADSFGRQLTESIPLNLLEPIHQNQKGFMIALVDGDRCCVGYAHAPGYEAFTTNWNSLVIQPIRVRP